MKNKNNKYNSKLNDNFTMVQEDYEKNHQEMIIKEKRLTRILNSLFLIIGFGLIYLVLTVISKV